MPDSKIAWAKQFTDEVNDGREEMYPAGTRSAEIYNFFKDIVSTDGDLSCISPGLKLRNFFHYDMQSADVELFAENVLPMLLKGK